MRTLTSDKVYVERMHVEKTETLKKMGNYHLDVDVHHAKVKDVRQHMTDLDLGCSR